MDPEVFTWYPIEQCVKLLDKNKYSRFAPNKSDDETVVTKDLDKCENIDDIKIKVKFKGSDVYLLKFSEFCQLLDESFVPQ